ncbi:MAG: hypothetical protein Q4C46_05680 [Bacillota bacterium]|nr:hypothetical protein [Bacillota bacterium]
MSLEKYWKALFRKYYLSVAFRHMRGTEKNINRIINMLFPDEKTFPPCSAESFEKSKNKEKMLSSQATGLDIDTEKLLLLISNNGCNYVGSGSDKRNNSGDDSHCE